MRLVVAVSVLLACAGAQEIREYTYPRSFEYISRGEIQTTMGQLAVQVRRLDELLIGTEPRTVEDRVESPVHDGRRQRKVVELLEDMERVARALGTGDVRSNHPRLDEGADPFRERLAAARRAAERDPPNYYLAGTVSGACRYCHY
jgi:hypothetical protein